eukprot:2623665-Pyramimonas_sp.AAC.1
MTKGGWGRATEWEVERGNIFKCFTPFRRPPTGLDADDDRGSYLVTVGPTCHGAWPVGQEPRG